MKRFTSIFAILSIILLSNACMDQNTNHSEEKDELEEVQETKNESMEKYREWSVDQGSDDSTQISRDSTSLQLVGKSLQL